jgi:hypothetical protein
MREQEEQNEGTNKREARKEKQNKTNLKFAQTDVVVKRVCSYLVRSKQRLDGDDEGALTNSKMEEGEKRWLKRTLSFLYYDQNLLLLQ